MAWFHTFTWTNAARDGKRHMPSLGPKNVSLSRINFNIWNINIYLHFILSFHIHMILNRVSCCKFLFVEDRCHISIKYDRKSSVRPFVCLLSWYPLILVKSLQLIWRSGTGRFRSSCKDLTQYLGTSLVPSQNMLTWRYFTTHCWPHGVGVIGLMNQVSEVSTYQGRVTNVCVSKLSHNWFKYGLVACSAPSHYL